MPPPSDNGSPSDDGGPAAGNLVTVAVHGPGRVTSTPAGIDCGAGGTACSARFPDDQIVLIGDAATTVRWSGACSGNGDCAVALGADASITADTFAPLKRTFDGSDHGKDFCFAVAAGPNDSIVAAGSVQRFSQGDDAFATAFDASGHTAWAYELDTPSEGHDKARSVIVQPDGTAMVGGIWFSGSNSHWNSFLLGFSPAGANVVRQESELVGDDSYSAAAIGPGGMVLVGARADSAGVSHAWMGQFPGGAAIDPAGPTPTPTTDTASAVAIDATGSAIVAGNITYGVHNDAWIAKYTQGAWQWTVMLANPGQDFIYSVATGPDNSITALTWLDSVYTLRHYAADGTAGWTVDVPAGTMLRQLATDAAGNVVATGTLGGALVAQKYAPDGALIWQRSLAGATADGTAVTVDTHGDVVTCGDIALADGTTDGLVVVFPQ